MKLTSRQRRERRKWRRRARTLKVADLPVLSPTLEFGVALLTEYAKATERAMHQPIGWASIVDFATYDGHSVEIRGGK